MHSLFRPWLCAVLVACSSWLGACASETDAQLPDSSMPDSSAPDSSVPDSNAPDSSAPDSSAPDSSAPDAARPLCSTAPEEASDEPPCARDLLCHLDGRCIEAGVEDAQGVASLAQSARPRGVGRVHGIARFVVEDDAVYWIDGGSYTPNEDHNGDASLHRFDLATREATTLATQIEATLPGLWVNSDRIYYATIEGIQIARMDGTVSDVIAFDRTNSVVQPWLVDGGVVYYATPDAQSIRRWRGADDDSLFAQLQSGLAIKALANGTDRLFVEVLGEAAAQTLLLAIGKDDGVSSAIATAFRWPAELDRGLVVSDGGIVSVTASGMGLTRLDVETGEQSEIHGSGGFSIRVESIDGGHIYFTGHDEALDRRAIYTLPIDGGTDNRQVHGSEVAITSVQAHEGSLYWIEGHRLLLRKAIDRSHSLLRE